MMMKDRFLFVSLGRAENHEFLLDFLYRVAEAFPSSDYVFLTDGPAIERPHLPNLEVRPVCADQFVGSTGSKSTSPSVSAMNQFIEDIEGLDFRKIYYLDALGWGFWITSCLPPERMKTISLSGFESPIQKYNYLLNLFDCSTSVLATEASQSKLIEVTDEFEFFQRSRQREHVLFTGVGGANLEKRMYSPFQKVVKFGEQASVPGWQRHQYVQYLLAQAHKTDFGKSTFPMFSCSEVVFDGDCLVTRPVGSEMAEYDLSIDIAKCFFHGAKLPSADRFLQRASVVRLRRIVDCMAISLEQQNRLFSGLQNQYLDLQIGNTLLELCEPMGGGDTENWRAILQDQLGVFSHFLVGYQETIQFDGVPTHTRGRS